MPDLPNTFTVLGKNVRMLYRPKIKPDVLLLGGMNIAVEISQTFFNLTFRFNESDLMFYQNVASYLPKRLLRLL